MKLFKLPLLSIFMLVGCDVSDNNSKIIVTVDEPGTQYWDSKCDFIGFDEIQICYGYISSVYKYYDESDILYYSVELQKYFEKFDGDTVLYQLKSDKSEIKLLDHNILDSKPYYVDNYKNIITIHGDTKLETVVSLQYLSEQIKEIENIKIIE